MRWTQEQVDAFKARMNASAGVSGHPTPIASPAPPQKATRQKYGNRKVTDAEGNVHDSTKEYRRWQELVVRERAGDIQSLRRQVPYALCVNGILIGRYIADFDYREGARLVVEDCKSEPTRKIPVYKLKKLLMLAVHGIEISEV